MTHTHTHTHRYGKQKQLLNDEMQRAKRAQAKSCPRNLLDGLAAVRRVTKEKKLKGVLGPLIENFTLRSEKMLVPVESTVGNQLFNVIVEQESTAATLMKTLVRVVVFEPESVREFQYPITCIIISHEKLHPRTHN